jgi:hypothetical protein
MKEEAGGVSKIRNEEGWDFNPRRFAKNFGSGTDMVVCKKKVARGGHSK